MVGADAPITRVELRDAAGLPLLRRTPPPGARSLELPRDGLEGALTVEVWTAGGSGTVPLDVPPSRALDLELRASPGAPWADVSAGGVVEVPVFGAEPTEVLLAFVGGPGHPAAVPWSEGPPVALPAPGVRVLERLRVGGEARTLRIGEPPVELRLQPQPLDLDTLRAALRPGEPVFPADATGAADLGRAEGRVVVPGPLWTKLTRLAGLGSRARDPWAPWAMAGLRLDHDADRPLDLVVTAEVRRDGAEAPAFRPRLRAGDGDTGVVSTLVRLPARGGAVVTLPVFVDEATVAEGEHELLLRVGVMGTEHVLAELRRPLYVQRGDTRAAVGFALSALAAAAGLVWTARRVRGWLEASATNDLMSIALFGAALFVVGTASDLLSLGVAVALGPFGTLLTGLVQDVGRTALLATLLTLLPRPGTLALALWTGWVGRSLTTGGFSPVDVVYTGAAVAWAEGLAWVAGLTRGGGWREEGATKARLRLVVAFAGAGVLTTLSGLWLHVVLYRLFFADWYLVMQALVPGGLYAGVAAWMAWPFATSLRRVEA